MISTSSTNFTFFFVSSNPREDTQLTVVLLNVLQLLLIEALIFPLTHRDKDLLKFIDLILFSNDNPPSIY